MYFCAIFLLRGNQIICKELYTIRKNGKYPEKKKLEIDSFSISRVLCLDFYF